MTQRISLVNLLMTALVAEVSGAAATVLATFSWETVGAGLMLPAFVLPSIVLSWICDWMFEGYTSWGYFGSLLLIVACFGFVGWQDVEGSPMAFLISKVVLVSGICAWIELRFQFLTRLVSRTA